MSKADRARLLEELDQVAPAASPIAWSEPVMARVEGDPQLEAAWRMLQDAH
jgi:hypothetical protein